MSHALDRLLVVEEDTPFTTGDEMLPVGGYIQDTLASSADDGDYTPSKYNLKGELYTIDTDGNALLTTIDADTGSILTEIQSLSHAEDFGHVSGDLGIMALAVRNDAETPLAADGDYIPLMVDSTGKLLIAGDIQVASSNTAINAEAITVGTTEVALPATPLAGREEIEVQNRGPKAIFVGPTGVTTATGLEVAKRSNRIFRLGPSVDIYGISATAGNDIRVFEIA